MILAIVLMIIVLALSLLSRTAAVILFIISLLIPFRYWRLNGVAWQTISMLILYILVALFLAWNIYELAKADPDISYDPSPYEDVSSGVRQVEIPFTVKTQNIDRLVLINFLEGEDEYYNGFEPQRVFDGQDYYYRVLAYKHDGSIDLYTESNSNSAADNISVAGQGINERVETDFDTALIEMDENDKLNTGFEFIDLYGREIIIDLQESPRVANSVPLDFLAPIGTGSVNPEYFPYFLMNDFDFMQTRNAVNRILIDGEKIKVEDFPVPLPVQSERRNFIRYSMDAEIIEFFPSSQVDLLELTTVEGRNYAELDGVKYLFDDTALSRIQFAEHELVFEPALDFREAQKGNFTITAYPARLELKGTYSVDVQGNVSSLGLAFAEVIPAQHNDIYERLIFNNIPVFTEWPLHYVYESQIDLETGQIDAKWTNLDID